MSWILIIFMTFFGAMGGLNFKLAGSKDERNLKFKHLIIGFGFYGAGALLNVFILRLLPYTIVFPLTSFTYIWTFIFSYYILGEIINIYKIIGIGLIIVGVFFLIH